MSILQVFKKTEPKEVFIPRGDFSKYKTMYVNRPELEEALLEALETDMNVLVQGTSGIGKTWLTRYVLEENNYYYKIINLASASSSNSIYDCFAKLMSREGWTIRTKYSEYKQASVSIPCAGGEINHTDEYITPVDYYMEFLKFMKHRAHSKGKNRYIIFENFEQILTNKKLIKELTNLIMLVDDDEVSKFNTKFIIIGATNNILDYFSKVSNQDTIDNRLYELPYISTLSYAQSTNLIKRGFDKIGIEFANENEENEYFKYIANKTNGIPQRIHELCLILSRICVKNDYKAEIRLLDEAVAKWIKTSFSNNYTNLQNYMTHGKGKRKNQILYCLGLKDDNSFSAKEVLNDLKSEFPYSNIKTKSITKELKEFTNTNPQLLVFNEISKQYYFSDIKNVLCIRASLYKDSEERVECFNFDQI